MGQRQASRGFVTICAVVLAIALAAGLKAYTDHVAEAVWHGQIAGCERSKLDRTMIAKAFRAQSDYLQLVVAAKSVKHDVKKAARTNQAIQNTAASSLESRTGNTFICVQRFKHP